MAPPAPLELDVVIFGGGAAGLWLLDELHRSGRSTLLLERDRLGSGQTVASQGIIHGGLKYSLSGLVGQSARAVRTMPDRWRRCLAGQDTPNLSGTCMRAQHCHLWQAVTLTSRLSLLGATRTLRVAPVKLAIDERSPVLKGCPGDVFRLDEQVIEPASFIRALAERHEPRLLKIDDRSGLRFDFDAVHRTPTIHLRDPASGTIALRARQLVLTAGAGNEGLRRALQLPGGAMQRRPLHMVVLKGKLPVLNGHCADKASTRVTITTSVDAQGTAVWQVGGQVSEAGVHMEALALIRHTRCELVAVLPGLDLSNAQWTTYRVDRAEAATPTRKRPDDVAARVDGPIITAWPTKLALVPHLVSKLLARLEPQGSTASAHGAESLSLDWPRPQTAHPPWDGPTQWTKDP